MKKLGLLFTALPIFLFFIERSSLVISNAAGKLYCGAAYLKEVNGGLSEQVCGFDSDMNLIAFLLIMMLSGMFMLVKARKTF